MPPQLENPTTENKRKLLVQALRKKAAEPVTAPLSLHQKRLWFLDQLEPGSTLYNIAGAARIKGPLDLDVVDRVVHEIIRRHESLRTTFSASEGEPVQLISQPYPLPLQVLDLSTFSPGDQDREIKNLVRIEAGCPFDLATGPLMRIILVKMCQDDHVALILMHHIIADGWSIGVLMWELANLYESYSMGKPSPLPELPIQYRDYVYWQQQRLQGKFLDDLVSYWKKELEGAPQGIQLPTDRPRSPSLKVEGASASVTLAPALSAALDSLSKGKGVTLFMTLLAALATLLYRNTGQEDILIGSPIADRERPETQGLIGFLVNTIVLRLNLSSNPTFEELVQRAQAIALAAYAHQELPFDQLIKVIRPERNFGSDPLLHVLLVLQNTPIPSAKLTRLQVQRLDIDTGNAPFDLGVECIKTADGMRVTFAYNAGIFDHATIERLTSQFHRLLESAVANPAQPIADMPMLSDAEQKQILVEWNATGAEIPEGKCIHHLFEDQARENPGAVALCSDNGQLTYEQLNERANRLAHILVAGGTKPETPVGICIERSMEMIVAILGVLKAGGAYVPLDPAYPDERLHHMVRNSGIQNILTREPLAARIRSFGAEVLSVDDALILTTQHHNPNAVGSNRDLAYIIYTSGSTGEPKGVMVEHRSVVNLITSFRESYAPGPADRVLQLTSISFDASVAEIFPILCSGGGLVIPPAAPQLNIEELTSSIARHAVTIFGAVPSVLAALNQRWRDIPSVRLILSGGETLSYDNIKHLRASATVTNGYGLTETTVCSLFHRLSNEDQLGRPSSRVPIGRPLINTQVFILDSFLHPVPVNAAGDLYIGGAGLARGYVNNPERTAQHFIPNPFARTPGERIYKTGDLARYRANGDVEFLGRSDQQVKIRGVRIELNEIEQTLRQHSDVSDAAAVVREEGAAGKRLVAYYALREGKEIGTLEIRKHMLERLPAYMVPSNLIRLRVLPLTPTGKLDYPKLLASVADISDLGQGFVAPRNEVDLAMTRIWASTLMIERVGIHDDFFALGGHSLLAVQVMNRIKNELQVDVPLRYLFESPTVAQLTERIETWRRHSGGPEAITIQDISSLVPMRTDSAGPAIYCIHHIGGEINSYNHLADLLASGHRVFGLRSRALADPSREHPTFDAMAHHYADVITNHHHDGPLSLVGYSSGGLLAMAIAEVIEEMGRTVHIVSLIDTGLPNYDRRQLETDEIQNLMGAIRDTFGPEFETIDAHWENMMSEASVLYRQLLPLSNDERLDLLCRWFEGMGFSPDQISGVVRQRLALYQRHLVMLQEWTLRAIHAPLVVFAAANAVPGAPLQEKIEWANYTSGGVEVETIDANHFTIVKPPAVALLAERLLMSIGRERGL